MSASPKVKEQQAKVARLHEVWSTVHALQSEGLELMIELGMMTPATADEAKPSRTVEPKSTLSGKPNSKQRSKARKPKADAIAPDGFEVGSQFVYTASPKGNAKTGAKSTWTVRSIEDAAVMAYRQGTSKARPWKFTSIAAMLQSGNISTDLSTVVTKPKARSRKAA